MSRRTDGGEDGPLFDVWTSTSEAFPGEQYVGRRARTVKKKREKRHKKALRSKSRDSHTGADSPSSSSREHSPVNVGTSGSKAPGPDIESQSVVDVAKANFLAAGAKYVHQPEEPEPAPLTPYKDDPNDPARRGSLSSLSPEKFEDELDEIAMRIDLQYHFPASSFYEQEKKKRQKKRFICFVILSVVKVIAILAIILHFVGIPIGRGTPTTDLGNTTNANISATSNSTLVPFVPMEDNSNDDNITSPQVESEEDPTASLDATSKENSGVGDGPPIDPILPPAPNDLAYLCSGEIDFMACVRFCEEAPCCWQTDFPSCSSDIPDSECRPYTDACSVLNLPSDEVLDHENDVPVNERQEQSSGFHFVPEPLADMEALCSQEILINPDTDEIDPEALADCRDVCLPGECCWQSEGSVYMCPDNPECELYASACSIIADLKD